MPETQTNQHEGADSCSPIAVEWAREESGKPWRVEKNMITVNSHSLEELIKERDEEACYLFDQMNKLRKDYQKAAEKAREDAQTARERELPYDYAIKYMAHICWSKIAQHLGEIVSERHEIEDSTIEHLKKLKARRDRWIELYKRNYHETYQSVGERGHTMKTEFGDLVDNKISRATEIYISGLEKALFEQGRKAANGNT